MGRMAAGAILASGWAIISIVLCGVGSSGFCLLPSEESSLLQKKLAVYQYTAESSTG